MDELLQTHTNTLWFEVLVTAKLGQINLSPLKVILIKICMLCDMFYSALHIALQQPACIANGNLRRTVSDIKSSRQSFKGCVVIFTLYANQNIWAFSFCEMTRKYRLCAT